MHFTILFYNSDFSVRETPLIRVLDHRSYKNLSHRPWPASFYLGWFLPSCSFKVTETALELYLVTDGHSLKSFFLMCLSNPCIKVTFIRFKNVKYMYKDKWTLMDFKMLGLYKLNFSNLAKFIAIFVDNSSVSLAPMSLIPQCAQSKDTSRCCLHQGVWLLIEPTPTSLTPRCGPLRGVDFAVPPTPRSLTPQWCSPQGVYFHGVPTPRRLTSPCCQH
jgi:hypothetical protein